MSGINGVEINYTPVVIPDERGIVRRHSSLSSNGMKIVEVYTTTIYRGIIKGWHGYKSKTIVYACVKGMVKLVLYDYRKQSSTFGQVEEIYLGEASYKVVKIPPGVLNGFKGVAEESLIVVSADEEFSEQRTIRLPYNTETIPYDWEVKFK